MSEVSSCPGSSTRKGGLRIFRGRNFVIKLINIIYDEMIPGYNDKMLSVPRTNQLMKIKFPAAVCWLGDVKNTPSRTWITKYRVCGLRFSKLLGCWSDNMEQFAVGTKEPAIDCWSVHSKDLNHTQLAPVLFTLCLTKNVSLFIFVTSLSDFIRFC